MLFIISSSLSFSPSSLIVPSLPLFLIPHPSPPHPIEFWLVDWLIDWLFGWLFVWLVARLVTWLVDGFIGWLVDCLLA
jgi:hypothetical protein